MERKADIRMLKSCPKCDLAIEPGATLADQCPRCKTYYHKTIKAQMDGTLTRVNYTPSPKHGFKIEKEKTKLEAVIDKVKGNRKVILSLSLYAFTIILIIHLVSSCEPDVHRDANSNSVDNYFNPFSGAHYQSNNLIKDALNDPASFDHAETRYRVDGEKLVIIVRFRARNSYGGVVTHLAKTECTTANTECRLIRIE